MQLCRAGFLPLPHRTAPARRSARDRQKEQPTMKVLPPLPVEALSLPPVDMPHNVGQTLPRGFQEPRISGAAPGDRAFSHQPHIVTQKPGDVEAVRQVLSEEVRLLASAPSVRSGELFVLGCECFFAHCQSRGKTILYILRVLTNKDKICIVRGALRHTSKVTIF